MTTTLQGIRVIDFSRILAGPFCTMMLADLGAEVIKIERPGKGDDSRAYGPFVNGESLYFISVNRGKKSVVLNLKNPKAMDFLLRLIDTADVLVENFKPGVMDHLGLSYETLSKRNPRLIYCSCSGYGHTGPHALKPAYDLIIQGITGMMSITGPDPEHPSKVGMSIADVDTGVFAAIGCLAALYQREKIGRGQQVDIAMFDILMAILENAATRTLNTGEVPQAIGNHHHAASPFASFKASDGIFNIAAGNDLLFEKLATALGIPELAKDPRFLTNRLRVQNWPALEDCINAVTSQKPVDHWCRYLMDSGVPTGPINNMSQALEHPQVKGRNIVTTIHHPTAGDVRCIASAVRLSDNEIQYRPSPILGADTEHYLQEILACSEKEASRMVQDKDLE
ncbi:MAG: CoA transferase [Proteobacteria bacterium]|nr:CoA transferase [Pseudomonadota bacterium]